MSMAYDLLNGDFLMKIMNVDCTTKIEAPPTFRFGDIR